MAHTEHANHSASDASQSPASQYHQHDATPPDEQIRGRAYEHYVERGSQPGDGVGDWLQAEREYYGQP
jgi:hypothetical protein